MSKVTPRRPMRLNTIDYLTTADRQPLCVTTERGGPDGTELHIIVRAGTVSGPILSHYVRTIIPEE